MVYVDRHDIEGNVVVRVRIRTSLGLKTLFFADFEQAQTMVSALVTETQMAADAYSRVS